MIKIDPPPLKKHIHLDLLGSIYSIIGNNVPLSKILIRQYNLLNKYALQYDWSLFNVGLKNKKKITSKSKTSLGKRRS